MITNWLCSSLVYNKLLKSVFEARDALSSRLLPGLIEEKGDKLMRISVGSGKPIECLFITFY